MGFQRKEMTWYFQVCRVRWSLRTDGCGHAEIFSDLEKHCFGKGVGTKALLSGLKGEGRKTIGDSELDNTVKESCCQTQKINEGTELRVRSGGRESRNHFVVMKMEAIKPCLEANWNDPARRG